LAVIIYNFNIWNTAIPIIQVWRKRRCAIIGVGGITSSTISSSTTLTANTYIITIKAMMGLNFTVTVMAPMTISEQFKDFWGPYGQFIGLFAGGFVGVFAKFLFDRRKKRQEEST
jgi:hypothetical protein